jgi:hypothetical protein
MRATQMMIMAGEDSPYIVATGGTITDIGNIRKHVFNSSGTFNVTYPGIGALSIVDYLVCGAGGGGTVGQTATKLGTPGAGGIVRISTQTVVSSAYSIVVGIGAAGATVPDVDAAGGGFSDAFGDVANGGNGGIYTGTGGSNADFFGGSPGGTFTTGGGAGAGGNGANAAAGSAGGIGVTSSISGASVKYGGGGGGGTAAATPGINGTDGGGNTGSNFGGNAAANRGGGGGACIWDGVANPRSGGNGADGVVIISYQFKP